MLAITRALHSTPLSDAREALQRDGRVALRPGVAPMAVLGAESAAIFRCWSSPPKQARAARPGAPQAPQAARSAAAGGGQQVREIKRHFRFRGFATNIEIRYKTT